jgi:hypothetical protein
MPTFRHGKAAVFKVDNNAGTLTNISDTLNSVSFPREAETLETTSFGSSDRSYVIGFTGATISIEGSFDATVDTHLAAIVGKTESVSFEYGPEGSTNGFTKYTGEAFLTSYETSAGVGDIVSYSAEFQVTGAITRGTYSA